MGMMETHITGVDICTHVAKGSSRDLNSGCENESEEELKNTGKIQIVERTTSFPDIKASPAFDFALDKESYDLE
ncbi:hypothetical protein QYM36_019966 [Artemia franciscana]|uniref:Uncharacterized protein n=1 Tax=Artemia franciscana TaxID=6661 RepID=A0AA88H9J3_ARTSF|nr:hypothetical protein QYM36_019966 [Artemia franciscana]